MSKVVVRFKRHVRPNGALHAPVRRDNIIEKLLKQHQILLQSNQLPDVSITDLGHHTVDVFIAGETIALQLEVTRR